MFPFFSILGHFWWFFKVEYFKKVLQIFEKSAKMAQTWEEKKITCYICIQRISRLGSQKWKTDIYVTDPLPVIFLFLCGCLFCFEFFCLLDFFCLYFAFLGFFFIICGTILISQCLIFVFLLFSFLLSETPKYYFHTFSDIFCVQIQ